MSRSYFDSSFPTNNNNSSSSANRIRQIPTTTFQTTNSYYYDEPKGLHSPLDTEEALKNFQQSALREEHEQQEEEQRRHVHYPSSSSPTATSSSSKITFLVSELHRLKFEEDLQRKAYYDSRQSLQEYWNKLVNLRSHIQRFQEEIEESKIEIISREAEHSIWTGDIDFLYENQMNGVSGGVGGGYDSRDFTLKSATRVAGLRNLRDKVKFKESIQSKILILQEELSHKKQLISKLSIQLQQSTVKVTSAGAGAGAGGGDGSASNKGNSGWSSNEVAFLGLINVDQSMDIRSQLLTLSDQIDDLEVKIKQYKQTILQLEKELNEHVDEVVSQEIENDQNFSKQLGHHPQHHHHPSHQNHSNDRSFSSSNHPSGAMSIKKDPQSRTLLPLMESQNEYLEIVTHGPPLSTDLINALVKGSTNSEENGNTEQSNNHHPIFTTSLTSSTLFQLQQKSGGNINLIPEFTLDEILAGQAKVYRMNGELPQTYLNRLEKRLLALQIVEVDVVKQFQEILTVVKRRREMLKDIENKRLKVELLMNNEERLGVATNNSTSHLLKTPASVLQGKSSTQSPEYQTDRDRGSPTPSSSRAASSTRPSLQTNNSFYSTPNITPHPLSASSTNPFFSSSRSDHPITPESISTIHRYPRTVEKTPAPVDVNNELAQNLRSMIRKILSDTMTEEGGAASHSPVDKKGGTKPHKALIEEETEILALISLYLTTATSSSLPPTPHAKANNNQISPKISPEQLKQSFPFAGNGGGGDDSLLDPTLLKTLKMQVLNKLLQENFPDFVVPTAATTATAAESKIESQSIQQQGVDRVRKTSELFAEDDDDLYQVEEKETYPSPVATPNFQDQSSQAYISPREIAMSRKINTDPIKLNTKRGHAKSKIDPGITKTPETITTTATTTTVPMKSNYSSLSLSSTTTSSKATEHIAEKVFINPKWNSTTSLTTSYPSSTRKLGATSQTSAKSPVTPSSLTVSPDPKKRYHSCSICAKLPKRPALDFSEFRKNKQSSDHRDPLTSFSPADLERPHRHDENGEIIYLTSSVTEEPVAMTETSQHLSSAPDNAFPKSLNPSSSVPLTPFRNTRHDANTSPIPEERHTTNNHPAFSSTNRAKSFNANNSKSERKYIFQKPEGGGRNTNNSEENKPSPALEEKFREEYFQKIAEETAQQLQEWKTKFEKQMQSSLSEHSGDSLYTTTPRNNTSTPNNLSSNAHHSRLASSSRSQTPTIGQPLSTLRARSQDSDHLKQLPNKNNNNSRLQSIKRDAAVSPIPPATSSSSSSPTQLPSSGLQSANSPVINTTNIHSNSMVSTPLLQSNTSNLIPVSATRNHSILSLTADPKVPYFIVRDDPTSYTATKRRDLSRDAVREVTSRLCQLAVELERSVLEQEQESLEASEVASNTAIGMTAGDASPGSINPTGPNQGNYFPQLPADSVLVELLQLVRQQQEDLHRLRDTQDALLKSNPSLISSLHSSLNSSGAVGGGSGGNQRVPSKTNLFSTQESLQTIHPNLPKTTKKIVSRDSLDTYEEEVEEVEEVAEFNPDGSPQRKETNHTGKSSENIQMTQMQSLLAWISMIESENAAHPSTSADHHQTNHHDNKPRPMYRVTVEEVKQLLTLLQEKYSSLQEQITQLQAKRNQTNHHHHSSPLRKASSVTSLTSNLEVEVILARHLPAMKHMSRSTDAYVELILLTFHPTLSALTKKDPGSAAASGDPEGDWKQSIPDVLSHFTDVDYNILNGNCVIRADMEFSTMEELYNCIPIVIGYHRTTVQNQTMYPNWRESFKFSLEEMKGNVPTTFVESAVLPSLTDEQRGHSVTVLWCLVRDSTRNGHQLRYKDEIIAQTAYQIETEQFLFSSAVASLSNPVILPALSVQASSAHSTSSIHYTITLSLFAPHMMKWRKGRVAIDPRAELKIGLQCFLSLERQYSILQQEIIGVVDQLEALPAVTAEELEALGLKNNKKSKTTGDEQLLFWMDSTVCYRIYRIFKYFKPLPAESSSPSHHQPRVKANESAENHTQPNKRKRSSNPNGTESMIPDAPSHHGRRSHSLSPQRTNPYSLLRESQQSQLSQIFSSSSRRSSSVPRNEPALGNSSSDLPPKSIAPAPRTSPVKVIGRVERNKSPPFLLRNYEPSQKKSANTKPWNSRMAQRDFAANSHYYEDRPLKSVHPPSVIEAVDEPAPTPRIRRTAQRESSSKPRRQQVQPPPSPLSQTDPDTTREKSRLNRSVDFSIFKRSGSHFPTFVAAKAFSNPNASQATIKKKDKVWR